MKRCLRQTFRITSYVLSRWSSMSKMTPPSKTQVRNHQRPPRTSRTRCTVAPPVSGETRGNREDKAKKEIKERKGRKKRKIWVRTPARNINKQTSGGRKSIAHDPRSTFVPLRKRACQTKHGLVWLSTMVHQLNFLQHKFFDKS